MVTGKLGRLWVGAWGGLYGGGGLFGSRLFQTRFFTYIVILICQIVLGYYTLPLIPIKLNSVLGFF